MKRASLLVLLLCAWTTVLGKQIEKVDFAEELILGNQRLVLNGAGLRVKKKLGMSFKAYVAGLYLPVKSMDDKAIIASPANKVLELVFLRGIDRETLQEAWQEGFSKNCKDQCEPSKEAFKAFNDTMVDVNENSRLKMTFDKGGVAVDIKGGKSSKKAQIVGEPFKAALMAIFIGDEPPTLELKNGLLGK